VLIIDTGMHLKGERVLTFALEEENATVYFAVCKKWKNMAHSRQFTNSSSYRRLGGRNEKGRRGERS